MTVTSLPQPRGRQKEVLYLPAQGHTVVLGTAGSGKTVLAILRSLYLSDPATTHGGNTLLLTFNRCLITYMKHLATAVRQPINIENYHLFARGYLASRNQLPNSCICSPDERIKLIRLTLNDARKTGVQNSILKRPERFFDEEFQWIQQHGISDEQDYLTVERIGRVHRIAKDTRSIIFKLYKNYLIRREKAGKLYDWSDLASAVRKEFETDKQERLYRHIIIDEGQDFSPEMLRSLALAIPDDGSITFFGDIAQQIYGYRTSWRSAGFIVPKIWQFEENYRNTKQIAQLALALAEMPNFPVDPDLVEPKSPAADGPLPALEKLSIESKEQEFVISNAKKLAETGTAAILLRTRDQENMLRRYLPRSAKRLHRDLDKWPTGPGLFYGTYHAAKGLEFDTVFLPFLSDKNWPYQPDVDLLGEQEVAARDSRLLYVGITRARSTLVLTYSGNLTSLLPKNKSLYKQ